ncbi:MAG: type II toxin-antitoxin system ParD family antitoxin [Alkalinema sp. RU_4_3]|jgi:antitoxin ParD1/3/4|nr:type II toxin-antitoxin system ParD family antitoxin [Alkalinema sp. RU_4_3]
MNIELSLPEELRVHVSEQIQSGAYGDFPEYLLDLVRRDRQRKLAQEKLVGLLNEGLASESEAVTPEYWEELRASVLGGAGVVE